MSYRGMLILALFVIIAFPVSAQTPTPSPEDVPQWLKTLDMIAHHWESIFKVTASIASIVGAAIGIIGGMLVVRRTRRELEILNERAAAAATQQVPIPTILTDPRLSLALLIAMDFAIATIITWLTSYAVHFVTTPANHLPILGGLGGGLGDLGYNLIQGIIVASLFWPIVTNARQLKALVISGKLK